MAKNKNKQPKKRGNIGRLYENKVKKPFKRDFDEVKEFYLNRDQLDRLKQAGRLKRWFLGAFYLLKGIILKLSVFRRIMVIIGLIFMLPTIRMRTIAGITLSTDQTIIGAFIFLFILMLELKDKTIAKDELREGRSVQLALLPETEPQIPNWDIWMYTEPANDVGGDLVDYLSIKDQEYALFLADVAGKGLPAALFMAKLQSTIRALATEFYDLSDIGQKINKIFYRDSTPQKFASLILIKIRENSDDIELINAGHLLPGFINSKGLSLLPKSNIAIGIKEDEKYLVKNIVVKPGEVICLYSDGITEAENEAGEFFGQEKLNSLMLELTGMSAQKGGEKILNEVKAFSQNTRPYDDISLIILKRSS